MARSGWSGGDEKWMDSQFTFEVDSIGLGDGLVGGWRGACREGSVRDGVSLVSGVSHERWQTQEGVHTAAEGIWELGGFRCSGLDTL